MLSTTARWHDGAPGVQWTELLLRGSGEAWRTRVIAVRVDPELVTIRLDTAFTPRRDAAWSLARVPARALVAVNAGQFEATMPWGWVVLNGRRWLPAQTGPLSAALAQDSAGTLHWVRGADVATFSASHPMIWAFQSYPVLLQNDSVVPALRSATGAVSVAHRDARAAICITRGDQLLIALTRFDAAGTGLGFVPFGITAPEMAAVMGSFDCRDAMLLDGGISARLRVRDAKGAAHDWEGLRAVPLGLVVLPREPDR